MCIYFELYFLFNTTTNSIHLISALPHLTPLLVNEIVCSAGYTFSNPTHDILQLARDAGMEGRVRLISCGAGIDQLDEIQSAFEDCMQAGCWLILQNVHLISQWSRPILDLIKVL